MQALGLPVLFLLRPQGMTVLKASTSHDPLVLNTIQNEHEELMQIDGL